MSRYGRRTGDRWTRGMVIGALLMGLALYALAGWIVWAAWDGIAVPVFGAPALTYWQTCGVLFALGVLGKFVGLGARGEK